MYSYEQTLQASINYFNGNELAAKAFVDKYALRDDKNNLLELTPLDLHKRLAKEFADIEKTKFKNPLSFNEILDNIKDFKYIIPQGSPMYSVGNYHQYSTHSNCYVLESPEDSYGGICKTDEELVQISKRRGGVGFDLSKLRPTNSRTNNSSRSSTGIPAWMERYSNSIREVGQSGRRGALMLTLNVHHPDIISFATIKNDNTKVTGANISVRLTDEFLNALEKNEDYELRFPIDNPTFRQKISAKKVWDTIINSAWLRAEPGLLFWDRIISESPADCYPGFRTTSTNPCGELPLCPNDSCRLLLLNLISFVKNPFTKNATFDFNLFVEKAKLAQRLMDDLIDLEKIAIARIIQKLLESDPETDEIKQRELNLWYKTLDKTTKGRRTGTGITALGDTLAALGLEYGSNASIVMTREIYKTLKLAAYRSSVDIAKELGPFSIFDKELEKDNPFLLRIKNEDEQLYNDMQKYGRRNIACLTTAPAGTVSLVALLSEEERLFGTTSGIEPLWMRKYTRRKKGNPGDDNFKTDFVDQNGDHWMEFEVVHSGIQIAEKIGELKNPYKCSDEINWLNRVKLQAAANKHVDHSISSTINLPNNITEEEVAEIYLTAWKAGVKGVTIYRDGCRTGVLVKEKITHSNAPKRPKEMECDVHHITVKGQPYFVLVGLFESEPYEVFAGKNGVIGKKVKKGELIKQARGRYKAVFDDETELSPIGAFTSDEEDCVTRLISTSLRHGTPIEFIVHQLEKAKGDLQSYSKCIARALKKYIADGTEIKGDECPECKGKLIRKEGCTSCEECGYSKC